VSKWFHMTVQLIKAGKPDVKVLDITGPKVKRWAHGKRPPKQAKK